MCIQGRTAGDSSWRSAVPILAIVACGAILPAFAQTPVAMPGEVIAVRELQLKAGADTGQFERFVRSTYNPAWDKAIPGMRGYVGKADRGAQKGTYALFIVFDSMKTRDSIFPKEGGGVAPEFAARVQKLLALNPELEKFLEPGTLSVYNDYVVMR
jgi:hypothetical protein